MPRKMLLSTAAALWVAAAATACTNVALLPLKNATADALVSHWSLTIPAVIGNTLHACKGVCPVPWGTLEAVLRQTNLEATDERDTQACVLLGKMLGAAVVVDGTLTRDEAGFSIRLKMVTTYVGSVSNVLCVGKDWSSIIPSAANAILQAAGQKALDEADFKTFMEPAGSPGFEFFSRAMYTARRHGCFAEVYSNLSLAISSDPNSAPVLDAMAQTLLFEGRVHAAESAAARAKKLMPRRAHVLVTLASVYAAKNQLGSAAVEAETAVALAPHDFDAHIVLAKIRREQGRADDGISELLRAKEISPGDPCVSADLALAYSRAGRTNEAFREAQASENLYATNSPSAALLLADTYSELGETNKFVTYLTAFAGWSTQQGAPVQTMRYVRARLQRAGHELPPAFFDCRQPERITPATLAKIRNQKLTPHQRRRAQDPLATTDEMEQWARERTEGATNELDTARRLFNAIEPTSTAPDAKETLHTAAEAFHALTDPKQTLTCQDYAFLYTSLARSVGLESYVTVVEQDYRGKFVSHACSAVVLGTRAILVDPAYLWFGVPHKIFDLEDDVRVLALYLAGTHDRNCLEAALALSPNWAPLRFQAAIDLALSRRIAEARRLLLAGTALDPNGADGWQALYTRGVIEAEDHNWARSTRALRKALDINPEHLAARYLLAQGLLREGDLVDAKREYEKCLDDDTLSADEGRELSREILREIDKINKRTTTEDKSHR